MTNRKTNEQFLKEFNALDDSKDYAVLDTYIKSDVKLRFKHLVCGNIFSMRPDCFLNRGQRCPVCMNLKCRRTKILNDRKKFNKKFLVRSKGEYKCLGIFNGATEKIKFRHLLCGHTFMMSPHHFIDDKAGCPFCFGTPRKTLKEFKEQIYSLYGSLYTILSTSYVNTESHIICRCNKCGNIWRITPANLLRGYGCPVCNSSKGERFLRSIMLNHNFKYEFAKKFKGLKDQSNLRYDFYLPEYRLLIEYQGKQHYEPVNFHGTIAKKEQIEKFHKQQYHDYLKYQYAKKHQYNFLAIPYYINTYQSIEEVLLKKIEDSKKEL